MYDENQGPIESLVHLYVDGAFSRRELIQRVARHTGSIAAALAALGGYNLAFAQTGDSCPAGIAVPADAEDLNISDVQFAGEASVLFGHLAYPKAANQENAPAKWPGVIVIHENRGLVEHIRDVTRRVARAGFVALGIDLLSRQGGTTSFADPAELGRAYSRTTTEERLADMNSSFAYLKSLDIVQGGIGAVGFCAGGGNVWNLAVNQEELAAAVPFYGSPLPTTEQIEKIKSPVLAIYAELDRNLTLRMADAITALLNQRKTFGLHIYQGVGHAFHNDTGPAYNAAAACEAWNRTLTWFNKLLRPPAA